MLPHLVQAPTILQVVELEIQLDEIKEQYNNVIRNSNSKIQQRKMAFLERNLEQLNSVQRQVSRFTCPPNVIIIEGDALSDRTIARNYIACRSKHVPEERSRDRGTQTSCTQRTDSESGSTAGGRGSTTSSSEPEIRSTITSRKRAT